MLSLLRRDGRDPSPDASQPVADAATWPDAPRPEDARSEGTDAPPDAGTIDRTRMARCEDSRLYVVENVDPFHGPPHGAGRRAGTCEGPCGSAAAFCQTADCAQEAQTLCNAPASIGATCEFEGEACQGTEWLACPHAAACGITVPGSTCLCTDGVFRCVPATAAPAVQAALVGKWQGTVTPPFAGPYPTTLWIYPDGTYWTEGASGVSSTFYYGGDGPSPDRRIMVLSSSDRVGAVAEVAIEFTSPTPSIGELSALVAGDTVLQFAYSPSWTGDSCNTPFEVTLTRY
jgi:hypothetical protein